MFLKTYLWCESLHQFFKLSFSLFFMEKEKTIKKKTKTEKAKIEEIKKNDLTSKGDFIEIEFVGRIKDTGKIFDTNIKKEAEKMGLNIEIKPLIVCIGQAMLVEGFDKELERKEIGKEYTIHLAPEDAFGKRNPFLVKVISLSAFKEKDANPYPGAVFELDGMIAKILSVSGGRVIVDFNNPLSSKEIEYDFTIKRKITKEEKKINALQDFFFKKRFGFSVEKEKIIFKKEAEQALDRFKEKFKEILGKEIITEEKPKEKKEEKKEKEGI